MTNKLKLSDHIRGISAIHLQAEETIDALGRQMRRFGPVETHQFPNAVAAFALLLPLKSFGSNYVVIGFEDWSVLMCDMRLQPCFVEAFNIAETAKCDGVTAVFTEDFRQFIAFIGGHETRAISCYLEGKWVFLQRGTALVQERVDRYSARRLRDRFTPEDVVTLFQSTTGISLPLSSEILLGKTFYGVTRVTKDVRVPIRNFPTIQDVVI